MSSCIYNNMFEPLCKTWFNIQKCCQKINTFFSVFFTSWFFLHTKWPVCEMVRIRHHWIPRILLPQQATWRLFFVRPLVYVDVCSFCIFVCWFTFCLFDLYKDTCGWYYVSLKCKEDCWFDIFWHGHWWYYFALLNLNNHWFCRNVIFALSAAHKYVIYVLCYDGKTKCFRQNFNHLWQDTL